VALKSLYTPTQQRILNMLRDLKPHSDEELKVCLDDELGPASNIRPHLTHLRKIIRFAGYDIVSTSKSNNGSVSYKLVKTTWPDADHSEFLPL
jgi:hypothetical protein